MTFISRYVIGAIMCRWQCLGGFGYDALWEVEAALPSFVRKLGNDDT